MTDAWHQASIKSFEHVPVAAATGLLRVAARSPSGAPAPEPRPALLADDGRTVSRFAALPAPADGDGILRAAYPIRSEMVTLATVFSLELADGFVIVLPDPTPGAARLKRDGAATAGALARADDDRREALPAKLTELSAQLGIARTEAAELRARADADAGVPPRSELLRAHLATAEIRAELHALRDLVALTPVATTTESDRAELSQRLAEAEQWLAEATTRAETAVLELAGEQDRARGLEEHLAEAQGALGDAERARDEALAARRQAEQSVAPLQAARARAERELRDLRDTLRKMTFERDEPSRQASAFDGVAVKPRERATEAEADHQQASTRLAELETWSAELERRLADATTQLADARAAAEADESELRRLRGELAEAHAQRELDQARLAASAPRGAVGVEAPGLEAPEPEAPELEAVGPEPVELEELTRAATAQAHDRAERDLAELASGGPR